MKNMIKAAVVAMLLAIPAFGAEPHSEGVSRVPIVPEASTYGAIAAVVAVIGATWYFRSKKAK